MKKKLILVMFFNCMSAVALAFNDAEMESILRQTSEIFDQLSPVALRLPANKNKQNEYLFSLCRSTSNQWGVVPPGQSEGFLINKRTKQIDLFNCQVRARLGDLRELAIYISRGKTKGTIWFVREIQPCYSKKSGPQATGISICHVEPFCHECQLNQTCQENFYFYAFTVAACLLIFVSCKLFDEIKKNSNIHSAFNINPVHRDEPFNMRNRRREIAR